MNPRDNASLSVSTTLPEELEVTDSGLVILRRRYQAPEPQIAIHNYDPPQKAQDAWEFRPKKPKQIPPKILRK